MKLINLKLKEFLDQTASKSAVPGGGSVSALAGALAAALVSMVCRLTIRQKGRKEARKEIKLILKKAETMRRRLMILADDDARAYQEVITAYESKRKGSIEAALKKATLVPLDTAVLSRTVLGLAGEIVKKGNKRAASDVKTACFLAAAAAKGALENVEINLILIGDKKFKKKINRKIKHEKMSL